MVMNAYCIYKKGKKKKIFQISIFPHWILMAEKKEKRRQYGDEMEYWIFHGIVGSTQFIVTLRFTFIFVFGVW